MAAGQLTTSRSEKDFAPCYLLRSSMVIADTMVEKVVQAISLAARTGKIGDGKVFLSRVDEVIRIRNDERGEDAV
jgi:nitrogen regulatory protein P-II 1